jgi:hypothetical protein
MVIGVGWVVRYAGRAIDFLGDERIPLVKIYVGVGVVNDGAFFDGRFGWLLTVGP